MAVSPAVSHSIPAPRPEDPSAASPDSPRRFLRFAPFEIDLERRELFRGGVRVKLQNKVFEALEVLLEVPGEIVTREALRNRLWPGDATLNYDANVNTTVNKLRLALGDSSDEPQFIETIPRKGYSFIAPVTCVAQLTSENPPAATAESGSFFAVPRHRWMAAAAVVLLLASVLFGAAVTLFVHSGFPGAAVSQPTHRVLILP
ncbi:MAG TPA: winged helix-turn-helix domain-containing protein [Candidatus Acidoferrales bacterium]|nr:winged helix-turn-helix domain-containing protein [Candidatus Acidoferrales bacterium]